MTHPPVQRLPWASIRGLGLIVGMVFLGSLPSSLMALQIQDRGGGSVVRGRVTEHETGRPLPGAAVSLAAGPGGTLGIGTRVTGPDGSFLFRRVPPGSYRLLVTLIGYREKEDTLHVSPDSDLDLSLALSVSPIRLEALVVVSERRGPWFLEGFQERRETRFGYFFDRGDIDRRKPPYTTDLFRTVPGARVMPSGPFGQTVRLRGGCQPSLWVDGLPLATAEGMDDILPVMDLEAVEVYHGVNLPVQFGSNPCGAIVVWTRRGEPAPPRDGFWRRVAFATGFAILAILAVG